MRQSLRWSLLSLSVISLLTACGELKKVDDMRDSTVSMGKTTTQMNDTTTGMKSKMDSLEAKTIDLGAMTNELYDTARQGSSLQLRRDAYDSMLKAPTFFKKLSEASKYFMSFEYQVWNNLGQDTEPEKREILAQQEALEFFTEIEELAPRDGSVQPTAHPNAKDIYSAENRTSVFNALAATIHHMNRKEIRVSKYNANIDQKSLYDLMEEALLAPRDKAQSGYIREIMAHEEKAIQILKTRYSMFPMMFIDMMTKISDKSLLEQLQMGLMGWDCDLDTLNATQLEYFQTEL